MLSVLSTPSRRPSARRSPESYLRPPFQPNCRIRCRYGVTRVGRRCRVGAASSQLPCVTLQKRWELDEAHIDVVQERDSTCHALMAARIEADPNRIFTLFERTDYDQIFEIFKMVRLYEILEDDGAGQRRIDLDVDAQWSFWKVSGDCFIPISMTIDRPKGEISFFQKYPGFLRDYRGAWRITQLDADGEPVPEMAPIEPSASLVSLELRVKPSILPPPPMNRLLKGNTQDQVTSLFRDLKAELHREVPVLSVDSILRNV